MFCPTHFPNFSRMMRRMAGIRQSPFPKARFLILENNLLYFPIMELCVSLWMIVTHRRNPQQKASFVQKSRSPGSGR